MPNWVRVRLRAWQRQAARSLTQATGQQAPWTSISGSNSYQFRQFSNAVPGPDFTEPDKKSMQYDRREHQKTDVAAKIKGQSGAEHQQHQPQQRLSLFPPADGQTSPKRYQYAGCHRTKDLAKVQNAFADILNRASWKRCLLTSDF